MPTNYTIDDLYKACESGTIKKINAILKKIPIDSKCITLALKNNNIIHKDIIINIAINAKIKFELEAMYEFIKLPYYYKRIVDKILSGNTLDIQCMYLAYEYYNTQAIQHCEKKYKYDIKCLELLCNPEKKSHFEIRYWSPEKFYDDIIAAGIVPNIQCLRNASGLNDSIYKKILNFGLNPDIECLRNAFLYKKSNIVGDILAKGILPDNECMVNLCKCQGSINASRAKYENKLINKFFDNIIAAGIQPNEECLSYAFESSNSELAEKIINYGIAPTYDYLLKICSMDDVNSMILTIIEKGTIPDYNCLLSLCKTKNNKKALREVLKHVNGDNECIYSAYTKK